MVILLLLALLSPEHNGLLFKHLCLLISSYLLQCLRVRLCLAREISLTACEDTVVQPQRMSSNQQISVSSILDSVISLADSKWIIGGY